MQATADLIRNVLRLANEVNAFAKQAGRADLSEVLAQVAARWKETETTLVIAGAQKRGKSRLINALVGRPGLLPVDADVATNCHLTLRHGPVLAATVNRADGDLAIDPEEIGEYASMTGDPAKRREVVGVDVTMDHPLLDGVRLLDTPGVDSLTIGHRQATVSILHRADALLFALSAQDQPVLRHELEFLAEAAERVQAVAFVLTKVEDSANSQALLEENQRRLATFVTEARQSSPDSAAALAGLLEAPWLPVSAKLAEAAAAQRSLGRDDRADRLHERSGMAPLEEYVRACASGRELTRSATVVSACLSVLSALTAVAEDHVAGASDDDVEAGRRLAEVEKALEELTHTMRDRRRRGVGNQFLGREVGSIVRARLARVRQPYEQAITQLGTRAALEQYLAQLPESVERSIQAAWEDILAEVSRLVGAELNEFLAALGLEPMEMDLAKVSMPRVWSHELSSEPADNAKLDLLREGVPAATMAVSIGMVLAHLNPIGFLVGPALAVAVMSRRREWDQVHRNQAALRRLVNDQFNQATSEITLALEREVATWRVAVEESADTALAGQRRELEARRAELRAPAARAGGDRDQARRQAADRLAAARALTERALALRTEIGVEVSRLA
ncbi:dynamin family protein [Sphaerimonospora thailandensis]|uniref:Dynamin n=1 Tax=Sphaerimonospora thailandensis TaxID=795644 RepID=A0A8J3RCQ2_9ACTN|nr:dynamin family protein [Sphaerimonospora thailandensis]GIH70123.1 dynamin [Sphaerimonospora thailandensis]